MRRLTGFSKGRPPTFYTLDKCGWTGAYLQMRLIPSKPKSLRITDAEYVSVADAPFCSSRMQDRFNALVDLVENKEIE